MKKINTIKYWDQKLGKYLHQDWADKPTIFAQEVITYFPKSGKVLDLGAGVCQDSLYFVGQGYDVTAADISDFGFKMLAVPGNVVFRVVDLGKKLPFSKESFDVVYSHLALQFFDTKRTRELFDEIYEILKPGGVLAVLVNSLSDPEIADSQKIGEDLYLTPSGLQKRFFSIQSLTRFTGKHQTIILDDQGKTYKDGENNLIRYVGKKPN